MVRRLGVPDAAQEDVMHEVFVVAHRRLPEYDGRASLTTWLYHLSRGVVSNFRRRRRREAQRLALVVPKGPPPDPEAIAGRTEAARFVRSFLEALPAEQRLVFELAEIDGLGMPEIAELAEVPLNTAYSRLRLARRRFADAVATRRGDRDRRVRGAS
jgi:RNA polymerase sigma-70 factor (ECF subfamily)